MKRPAFQFYPADWRKDSALQSTSIGARGLWIEMVCIMHECEPYGHLSVNGKALQEQQLARLVGESANLVKKFLTELEDAGVFSRTENGCIYSRRMVKDESLRNIRSDSGRLGGNPTLVKPLVKQKDNDLLNQADNLNVNQSPTPSSSSSSSKEKPLSGGPDQIEILEHLNQVARKKFRPVPANLKLISARLVEGATVDECKAVIERKTSDWISDPKMSEYLRPATLFNATNFAQYVGAINGAAKPWDL